MSLFTIVFMLMEFSESFFHFFQCRGPKFSRMPVNLFVQLAFS